MNVRCNDFEPKPTIYNSCNMWIKGFCFFQKKAGEFCNKIVGSRERTLTGSGFIESEVNTWGKSHESGWFQKKNWLQKIEQNGIRLDASKVIHMQHSKKHIKKMDMYRLSTGWNRWIFSLFASCKRTVEWFDDLLDLTWPRVWWPDVSWQESSNLEIQTNGCRSGANVRRWLMENCRRVWELSNKRPGRRSVEFFTVDPRRWALMKVVAEIWG